jgi:hypothetical protein
MTKLLHVDTRDLSTMNIFIARQPLTSSIVSKFSADNICFPVVPKVIAHCTPLFLEADLNTTFIVIGATNKPDVPILTHNCTE